MHVFINQDGKSELTPLMFGDEKGSNVLFFYTLMEMGAKGEWGVTSD